MGKRKANHVIPGANAASAQGKGTGYNEEFANEPLTEAQKQNNKKRRRTNNRQKTPNWGLLISSFLKLCCFWKAKS